MTPSFSRFERKASSGPALVLATILWAGAVDQVVTNVRQVDFESFTYRVWGDHDVQVRRGAGVRQKNAAPTDPVVASIQTAYGDLTGDGKEEAAVIVWFMAGGNGVFSEGFVYSVKDGTAQLLAGFEGGDRAANGLWTVSIVNQNLIVERESGPCMGCTERIITTRYRWDGEKLVPTGTTKRRWDGKYPPGWRLGAK